MDPPDKTLQELKDDLRKAEAFLATPDHQEFKIIVNSLYEADVARSLSSPHSVFEIFAREQAIGSAAQLKILSTFFEDRAQTIREQIYELDTSPTIG